MLVKRSEISKITMLDNENNDFCVVFHLGGDGRNGKIIRPCFFAAGFSLDDPKWVEAKAEQIRLAQEYIDKHPQESYVELDIRLLYNMNVYH